MKPTGFLAGLAVGLLGLAAFVVTNRSAAPAAPLDQLHEAAWLERELQLDAGQLRQVQELDKAYARDVSDCCANHCGARKRLGEAVFGEGRNPLALEAMVARMGQAQLESDLATVRHIQAVHAILRPDQQKKFEDLVTRCVCADCPNCSEHAEPEKR